ncbi:C3H1-type domain-containing protein [Plasmodiophora brassicae]
MYSRCISNNAALVARHGAAQRQQKLSGASESSVTRNERLYKTEMCRLWGESRSCPYGAKCQFAHGEQELRPVERHAKFKTVLCRKYHEDGVCPFGARCAFVHKETATTPLVIPLDTVTTLSPPTAAMPTPVGFRRAITRDSLFTKLY